MKTLIVPDNPSGKIAVETIPTLGTGYPARYICLLQLPFAGNKRVKIRPSYHERIREIICVIGRGDAVIMVYVDKAFEAHLDDNQEIIERLLREREAVASLQSKAEERWTGCCDCCPSLPWGMPHGRSSACDEWDIMNRQTGSLLKTRPAGRRSPVEAALSLTRAAPDHKLP